MNEFMRVKVVIEDWSTEPFGITGKEADKKKKFFGQKYYRTDIVENSSVVDIDSTWVDLLSIFQDALIAYGYSFKDDFRFRDVINKYLISKNKESRNRVADTVQTEPPEEIWKTEDTEPSLSSNTTDGYYKEPEDVDNGQD